jgi:hypothetical protein
MEALYKQRVGESGLGICHTAEYARILLEVRGDTQACDLTRGALNQNCDDSKSREILGLGEYVDWAATTAPLSAESSLERCTSSRYSGSPSIIEIHFRSSQK